MHRDGAGRFERRELAIAGGDANETGDDEHARQLL
jgi:hypothetical protein